MKTGRSDADMARGGHDADCRSAGVTAYPRQSTHDNSLGSVVGQRDGHSAESNVSDFTDGAKAGRPAPVMDRTGRVDPGHDVRHPIGPTVGLNGGHMPSHTCVSGQLYRPDTAP